MNSSFTRCVSGLLWMVVVMFTSGEATAHGGLAMEKDYCKLRVGPHVMHFTGYQPGDGYRKEFCEDIPSTGATIVVLRLYRRRAEGSSGIDQDHPGFRQRARARSRQYDGLSRSTEDLSDGDLLIQLSVPRAGKLRRAGYGGRWKSTGDRSFSVLGRRTSLSTIFVSGSAPRHGSCRRLLPSALAPCEGNARNMISAGRTHHP